MKKRFLRLLLLFIFINAFSVVSYAQKNTKLLKEADAFFADGDYDQALPKYLLLNEDNPDNPSINFRIAICYLNTPEKETAISYFKKTYEASPNFDDRLLYFLGEAYHYHLEFDNAIEYYNKYLLTKHPDEVMKKLVMRKIEECNNGIELVNDPVDAKIEDMGSVINSKYPEYAPVISADESVLIFTSRRSGSTGGEMTDDNKYYEDIYISTKTDKVWSAPKNIGTNINTDGHDACVALSADGKTLFVYKDDGNGDIYMCKRNDKGEWSKPAPLPAVVNGKKSYENSVCLSPDGKTLFFVSNRDGGYGGLDIYKVSIDEKGKYGVPVNLGSTVNTEADEDGPFMDMDGKTLYFSSKLHKGMGGFDIFRSVYNADANEWSVPENLGYPINTPDDDIFFVLSGNGKTGYYASYKKGGFGEKDLYKIIMPKRDDYELLVNNMKKLNIKVENIEPEKIVPVAVPEEIPVKVPEVVKQSLQPLLLSGTVNDAVTGKPIPDAGILIQPGNVKIKTSETGEYEIKIDEKNYTQKLKLTADKKGYNYSTAELTLPALTSQVQYRTINFELKQVAKGNKVVLRNIYFDFDKWVLKPASYDELSNVIGFLNDNPAVTIEISGHTDEKGSAAYNKELSLKRAGAVKQYLIKKGISSERLSSKGMGEEQPMASNDDEEEGRELNRRIEFEILGK